MNAKTAIEIALRGGVIPALAAWALFFLIGLVWADELARRYRAGLAFALAVFIGLVLLPSTKTLAPNQFYDWIPYLGVLAALGMGLIRANGVSRAERWVTIYLFAPLVAWLIVPRWAEMVPAWPFQWAGLAIAIILLTALLYTLPPQLAGRLFPWWLAFAAAVTSILIFDRTGETFGRKAALPAGALAGCGVAALFAKEVPDWRGLILPYSVIVGGYAYTGFVYPTERLSALWPLLLAPAAPAALWICTLPPLARLQGGRRLAAQAICVALPLIVVAAVMMAPTDGTADTW